MEMSVADNHTDGIGNCNWDFSGIFFSLGTKMCSNLDSLFPGRWGGKLPNSL